MPTLVLTNFNIVCATLGGFVISFGLVSYLVKERFYLSEARESPLPSISLIHFYTLRNLLMAKRVRNSHLPFSWSSCITTCC